MSDLYVVIVGCGKVGARFAKELTEEGHDVVIVDNDVLKFKNLGDHFEGLTVVGFPIDKDILKVAGIENADAFVAVTPKDNINIMASQIAKEIYQVPVVLARIYDPQQEHIFQHFGLETLCPTDLTVEKMKNMLLHNNQTKSLDVGKDSLNFRTIVVDEKFVGKHLSSLLVEEDEMIMGIIREEHFYFNHKNIIIERDDAVVFVKKID